MVRFTKLWYKSRSCGGWSVWQKTTALIVAAANRPWVSRVRGRSIAAGQPPARSHNSEPQRNRGHVASRSPRAKMLLGGIARANGKVFYQRVWGAKLSSHLRFC